MLQDFLNLQNQHQPIINALEWPYSLAVYTQAPNKTTMSAQRDGVARTAKNDVESSGEGAKLKRKRKPQDNGHRPARPPKKKAKPSSPATTAEDDDGVSELRDEDEWDPEKVWDKNEFPRDIGCHYFHINRSNTRGKTLETTKPFIPAGTLLWEEHSLVQDFKEWPQRGSKAKPKESKEAYAERIVEQVWHNFSDEDKDIFTNFHWYERGTAGVIEFTANDMASRIDANAGPDDGYRGKVVAYRHLNFISHSCRPNCRIADLGYAKNPRWALRTLVPIDEVGTVLTIDYDEGTRTPSQSIDDNAIAYLIDTVKNRQESILANYQFSCTCEACVDSKATNKARKRTKILHRNLMKADLPKDHDNEEWKDMAGEFDENVNEYIRLCKDQHLFQMVLEAHKRAVKIYRKAGRKAGDKREISRADVVREEEHLYGQVQMRQLLYGLWDPKLQALVRAINSKAQKGRK